MFVFEDNYVKLLNIMLKRVWKLELKFKSHGLDERVAFLSSLQVFDYF